MRHTVNRLLRTTLLLAAVLAISTELSTAEAAVPPSGPASLPAVGSPAVLHTQAVASSLMDVASGRLLSQENGDKELRIASLTKIMTAIVAIENGKLDEVVTVSPRAAGKEGSSLYLKAGEKIKLVDLLYGLMLRSGNDAATAIAEHVGGSVEGFAYLMNLKAEELGMEHSRFANPSGLDQEGHYSSANDLARLASYALHNDTFRSIVRTKVKTAPNPNEKWEYKWINKNKMLLQYEGADGVKTGYTKKALRCLVSSATRNGQQLVAVTLNDRNDWQDHRRLLDYGFEKYPLETVIKKGETVAGYPFVTVNDFRYPFADGEREKLRLRIVPIASDSIDYAFGARGKLALRLGDQEIGTVGLAAAPSSSNDSAPNNPEAKANGSPPDEQARMKSILAWIKSKVFP
ncbi:D-alanyl-D-alanine carboxypeptidase family protein [Cohnella thailandensis]|uniref:D-alanyl-D-alanine carboxypeptidase n=1 Tax=Cohnella thailandensis TaxID=557557 RepID=A0A841SXU9_9BACL|nr:D-alanyl-D-alanine carboxypeptidase family protein [Cohnella thailandensis]MBB6635446.1 D-alanyl-D-alanine carboxypeptidase [Cohnella thailandensis]MBP1974826.1 D-alanyl-D-alanine carboxypeptidase [Cohnella thailandensis]